MAPAPLYLSCPLVILVFVYVFIYVCVHVCSHTGAIVCVPGGGVVRGVRRQPIFHHVGPEGQTQALRQASTPALSEAWRPLPSEAFTAEEELQGEHSGGCTPSTCVPHHGQVSAHEPQGNKLMPWSPVRQSLPLTSPTRCLERPVPAGVPLRGVGAGQGALEEERHHSMHGYDGWCGGRAESLRTGR